jgi:WS/DGAT/MGAT family acyltransferase
MYVVEGLAGGQIGVVAKTHHAAIDGVSGADLLVNLLDLSPSPAPAPVDSWEPERLPSDVELVAGAAIDLSRRPLAMVKAVRRTLELTLRLRERNRVPGVKPPPAPFSAPKTKFNVPITPHRRFALAQVSLDDVKKVKASVAFRVTVNDVVLALCAGALRRYLDRDGSLPFSPLVAMVPVSLRTPDQQGAMGNQVSAMLVSLATDVADPLDRLQAIAAETREAKEQETAAGVSTLADWADFMAPAIAARAARMVASTAVLDRLGPIFNVVVSNVPGPPFPLYSAGARLVSLYPMGPIADGMALNMTVMSYLGTVHFGLVSCRETMPDLWDLATDIGDSLAELLKAVSGVGGPAGDSGGAG